MPVSVVPRRVLLVEDSAMLRKLIRTALLPDKVELTVATNGLEAVDVVANMTAQGRSIDLILMDVVMPELNGVEATWKLRQQGYAGKIVILTAADSQFDMAASLCAGANDFLPKPFSPDDLRQMLNQHCPQPAAA